MIQMGKKGVPHIKTIQKAMVGLREMDAGEMVFIQLDDFEVYLSDEKADSLAAQLMARARKVRDHRERDKIQKEIEAAKAELQGKLLLPEETK